MEFFRRVLETRLKRTVPRIFEVSALIDWSKKEQIGIGASWFMRWKTWSLTLGAHWFARRLDRGIRRAAYQLLAVIKEERSALERPLEESEKRLVRLRRTIGESEIRMRDLGVLLTAEQQRLSSLFGERRNVFLKLAWASANSELTERLSSVATSRNGPAYRRNVNHAAQEVAGKQLKPWLESEAAFAEEEFRKTANGFVELPMSSYIVWGKQTCQGWKNSRRILVQIQGLRVRSRFYFNVIEKSSRACISFSVHLGSLAWWFGNTRWNRTRCPGVP